MTTGDRAGPGPTRRESLVARLPSFVTDLLMDREAALALLAACVALAAAGLDPHVLDPGSRRTQAAMTNDQVASTLVAGAALVQAGFVLLGGAVADIWRSRRLLQGALIGLVVACIGATLMPDGPGLVASRVLAWACDGLIIPFAVGIVAIAYKGRSRATALGILFAVYGATTALAPALVTAFGSTGPEVQAFALCAAVAVAGIWTTRRYMPDLPGALASQRLLIVTTAAWAFGVVAVVTGLVEWEPALIVIGGVIIAAALAARRVAGRSPAQGVHVRTGGAALAAGFVVGFVQAVPMLVVPVFFSVIQGIQGLMATLLIAPFAIALFAAGPVAGWLLARYTPRVLILGGVWAITIADVIFFLVMSPGASYLWFIVPFILVGGGFVIATAIRTAVIFASTPARLPATAAALNEASIGVGARLGVTMVVVARSGAVGNLTELQELQLCLAVAAVVGVIGGIAVFLLLGRHDPVRSVWDLREERSTPA